jgi:long-chain acyl-CoA synthetase
MRSEELRLRSAPALLAERARIEPAGIAYRATRLGLYREQTWGGYAREVARVAHGLLSLGVAPGERVAIMADVCEEWLLADQGAQAIGAIVYGIYPTASAEELAYQMTDGGAVVFVAEDQEYVDKVLAVADRLPELRWIVVVDESAMLGYEDRRLTTFARLQQMGGAPDAGELDALARRIEPDAPAFIVYTSGTSGLPKGALVSHGRHLAAASNLLTHFPTLVERPHRTVAYLPLCHILGRDIAVTLPLLSRLVPHIGEEVDDLPRTLFEVAPTVLFTVPRYLQKIASQMLVAIGSTSGVKRAVYDWAMRRARAHAQARWTGHDGNAAAYELARGLVFKPMLDPIGLARLELLICGGAPLPEQTMALWQLWGVNVVEIYGQTETAGGIISGQRGPFPRPGNVGTVPENWNVRLADDGEILIGSDDVFDGYWRDDAATQAAFIVDQEGARWLRSGDVGQWQGDALKIVDRARDFIVTAGGKTLSPSFIENHLRAIPYVGEAMVVGHGRKYLTALIEIDFESVADWARGEGLTYTGFTSLVDHPRVQRLIAGEITRVNDALSRVEQIKSFRILPKALDPEEEGEPVTPTRKLKRARMLERFGPLVEAMYDNDEEQRVAADVGDVLRT